MLESHNYGEVDYVLIKNCKYFDKNIGVTRIDFNLTFDDFCSWAMTKVMKLDFQNTKFNINENLFIFFKNGSYLEWDTDNMNFVYKKIPFADKWLTYDEMKQLGIFTTI